LSAFPDKRSVRSNKRARRRRDNDGTFTTKQAAETAVTLGER
jgi:hypothetical protein